MFLIAKILLIFLIIKKLNCDFEWMYYKPYGTDVILKPLKRNETEGIEIIDCKWTTPKNIDLLPDQVNFESDRYRIDKTACELMIYNIQADTNGIYHSIINKKFISKAMLNYHGPPPKDFLDEYKWNLVAGFSTAGGILALFIFVWALNKYRYKEPDEPIRTKPVFEINTGYEISTRDISQIENQIASFEDYGKGVDVGNEEKSTSINLTSNQIDFEKISQTSSLTETNRNIDEMHRF